MIPVMVLVPNYNKAPFIARTLESLRGQTFREWNCIIVDNYSDDGSWEIISRFAAEDERFTAEQLPRPSLEGRPFYRTWNHAVSKARGACIAILTSDDLWEANWLESAYRALEASPEAVACAARTVQIDAQDRHRGIADFNESLEDAEGLSETITQTVISKERLCIEALLLGPIFTSIHSLLIRRSVFDDGLRFAEDLDFAADHEFYMKLSQLGPVVYTNKIAAHFRVYPDQASSSVSRTAKEALFAKAARRNIAPCANTAGVDSQTLGAVAERILRRRAFLADKPKLREWSKQPIQAAKQFFPLVARQPTDLRDYILDNMAGRRYVEDFAVRETQHFLKQNGISERA